MSGSPMDPVVLATLRRELDPRGIAWPEVSPVVLVSLLDDRDHWEADRDHWHDQAARWKALREASEAKARKFRSRCPVTAEDVERAAVTSPQAQAWLRAQDLGPDPEWLTDKLTPGEIADLCILAHEDHGYPVSMSILDEMAKGAAR